MGAPDFKVLHIEDDPVNALVVSKMLETAENPAFQVLRADCLLKALDLLAQHRFDAAVVDLNLPDSTGIATFLAIQRNAPSVAIIVLSGEESESLAMTAVELGAQDYLAKTGLKKSDLIRAVQYAVIRSRKRAPEEREAGGAAGVVGLMGSKGGVGVTTLACHIARELKRQTGDPVVISGFDSGAAGVSYLMKAQCQHTIADAAQNLHRLDRDLWRGYVYTAPDGVDVLAPPGASSFFGQLEVERVGHVLRVARSLYSWIVLDLGVLNLFSLGLLEHADHVYLITSEDLPALWEAGRQLKRLRDLAVQSDRVRLVVNQKKRRNGVPLEHLQRALGYPIEAAVTAAWEEQNELLASSRFVDEKSKIRKDTVVIVSKLLGKDTEKSSSPFKLSRLLRG